MTRTNPSDVSEIYDTELSNSALQSWIDIATEIVDDIAAEGSVSSARLEKIEKLLSAHFASAQDQRIQSGGKESGSVEFQGETGMGLDGTKYGQQAKTLDPTGTLASMNKPMASVEILNAER